jgi:lipopolysaccharide exporter
MSQARAIASSSIWLTGSQVILRVVQFVAQIVVARLLSPEDFGIWAMVMLATMLSNLFKESAIAQVLVHRGLEDEKQVNAVFSLGVNVSIGLFFAQALVGLFLSHFFKIPLLFPLTVGAGLVFVIGAGMGAHNSVMVRQMRFRQLAICDIAAGFARYSALLLGATLGAGIWCFVAGELAMRLVESVLKHRMSGYHFTYQFIPDPDALKEVWSYIQGLISSNLAVFANTNGDNLIIGRLLGATDLGYYNLAYQLATTPVYFLSFVNRVNFSVLAQREGERRQQYVQRFLELYALMSAPVFGMCFVAAPWLIPLMYGAKWSAATSLFQYVLVFAYARGFMSILGTTLNAAGYPGVNAFINWALIPLSLPAFYFGAQWGGVKGVAIAVALVMGVLATVWFWVATCRTVGWRIAGLAEPIVLPTAIACASVAVVLKLPVPGEIIYVQPIELLLIYAASLTLISGGQIPRMLMDVARRSLKAGNIKSS